MVQPVDGSRVVLLDLAGECWLATHSCRYLLSGLAGECWLIACSFSQLMGLEAATARRDTHSESVPSE